jgi:RNA 2',3'-cyclic 3'-phosphodiesterase
LRLFVAVDVPREIKEAIEKDVVDVLRPALQGPRWTRPEGRHLTLEFLGETPDERIPEIARVLRKAAKKNRPFETSFEEIGGFPTLRRPRVIWIGLGEGADQMRSLAADVNRELEPLGFDPESRPFTPHYTLARFARPRVIAEMADVVIPHTKFAVNEVVLFRSQLHPKGARYTALEQIPLGK